MSEESIDGSVRTVEWEYGRLEQQHIRDANRADDTPDGLSFDVAGGVISANGTPESIRWLYDYLHFLKRAWRHEGEQWDADVAEEMAESLYEQVDGDLPDRQRAKVALTDGGVVERDGDQLRVAVPRPDSQGECYHAPDGPCGSHLLRNVTTTVGELRSAGLYPCSNCVDDHGLPDPDGGGTR